MLPEIVTVDQARQYLQVSDSTLRRYIRQGKLPAMRLERDLRFRRQDVEALLHPVQPKEA